MDNNLEMFQKIELGSKEFLKQIIVITLTIKGFMNLKTVVAVTTCKKPGRGRLCS